MRVLITGAGGQLGRELVHVFCDHEVIAMDHSGFDVSDRDQVLSAVTSNRPDVIVHSAAMTNVDACETDVDRAFAVNALAVRHIAEGASRVGAYLCTISTDYVFDGEKKEPYHEWDMTNPVSVYGHSKLAGEHEAFRAPEALVTRLSWVCGRHGDNFVKTVLRLTREHDTMSFVDDQHGHPTFADDAAGMIRRLVADRRTGIVHVTNQGVVSRYEFARAVLEAAGQDPERVTPISTDDMQPPRPARRPKNSALDNAVLRFSGLPLLPHYRESLERLVGELVAG